MKLKLGVALSSCSSILCNAYIYCESIEKRLYILQGRIYKKMDVISLNYCDQESSMIEMRFLHEAVN